MRIDSEALNHANAMEHVARAVAAIRAGDGVLDFSPVHRCDSAAVALALECLRTARAVGRPLRLEGIPAPMASLARLYGVEELLRAAS